MNFELQREPKLRVVEGTKFLTNRGLTLLLATKKIHIVSYIQFIEQKIHQMGLEMKGIRNNSNYQVFRVIEVLVV